MNYNAVEITVYAPSINQWRLNNKAQTLQYQTCALAVKMWHH